MSVAGEKRIYSRSEYISDMVVHLAGLVAVATAVPVVIFIAAGLPSGGSNVTAAAVYGLGLVAMIGCSALYNIFPQEEWEWLLKRLDHSAIYLKIAGTYTAFVLLAGQGYGLAVGLWVAAATGITLKVVCPHRWRYVSLTLYLGMGWAAAVLGWAIFAALPGPVVTLVATGGILYTVGVLFFLWDRLPHHTTIWHLFVLAASFTIYAGFVVAVLTTGTGLSGI